MRVWVEGFQVPKAGNKVEECEDAYCPKICGVIDNPSVRFAVADGASEAMLSDRWAGMLVESFYKLNITMTDIVDKDKFVANFLERIYPLWERWKDQYIREREKKNRPLQWFEEPGFEAGSAATFLGIIIEESYISEGPAIQTQPVWTAISVGDTCLFLVRNGNLVLSHPLKASKEFNSTPALISTLSARNIYLKNHLRIETGEFISGDRIYLMTDALSCWFIREFEKGEQPWKNIENLLKTKTSQEERNKRFISWVEHLRKKNELQNDDVTLLYIERL